MKTLLLKGVILVHENDFVEEWSELTGAFRNWNEVLKVNKKDNTITIKKVKEYWDREEVINLLDLILFEKDLNFDKWIAENL